MYVKFNLNPLISKEHDLEEIYTWFGENNWRESPLGTPGRRCEEDIKNGPHSIRMEGCGLAWSKSR